MHTVTCTQKDRQTQTHTEIFYKKKKEKTKILSQNATDKSIGSWLCFGKGIFMTDRSGAPCPSGFMVHCSDPEISGTMLSADGGLAFLCSLHKNKERLLRCGPVM